MRYFSTLRRRLQPDGATNEVVEPVEDAMEPEPDAVNPTHEESDHLDSSDDEDSEDRLTSIEDATPTGFKVKELPPEAEQLVYKGERAQEMVGKSILFNWRGVGWCDGVITLCNVDGRVKMKVGDVMKTVNFFAHYSDETEARHCLQLDTYGDSGPRADGRWLLLEQVDS